MRSLAVYPGSFDPLTFGHADLVRRAARLFDRLVIAVSRNTRKTALFTIDERLDMARQLTADIPNAEVDCFDGLLVDYARGIGARSVIRGLRAFSDFEYELQMALMNRKLAPDMETLFLMPKEEYSYVSSSMVREIASLGGDTGEFVPGFVSDMLRKKFRRKKAGEQ